MKVSQRGCKGDEKLHKKQECTECIAKDGIVLIFGEKWELNSAGLECYPYKVKVIGSNPIIPTKTHNNKETCSNCYFLIFL